MDMGRTFIQMDHPIQNVNMGTEPALEFFKKFSGNLCQNLRRNGFIHGADLVDAFLRAGLTVFQQIRHGAVAFGVPGLFIPGILRLYLIAVMPGVIGQFDLLKAEIKLLCILLAFAVQIPAQWGTDSNLSGAAIPD